MYLAQYQEFELYWYLAYFLSMCDYFGKEPIVQLFHRIGSIFVNSLFVFVRRTQNRLNLIENDKLVSKVNSSELFEEIKKACKENPPIFPLLLMIFMGL